MPTSHLAYFVQSHRLATRTSVSQPSQPTGEGDGWVNCSGLATFLSSLEHGFEERRGEQAESKAKMRITREWSEKHHSRRHEKHAGDIGHASASTHPDIPLRGTAAAKFLRVRFLRSPGGIWL